MANSISAVLPQYWAFSGLRYLLERAAAVAAVNKQFAPALSRAGQTVNAWRVDKRVTRRKTRDDQYTATDASITPVPVVLNQYYYDSIVIKDEEEAITIPQLTETHLFPMIDGIVRGLERSILGRVHAFLRQGTPRKRAGRLTKMTTSNADDFILEAEEVLQTNLAPMEGLWTAIVHQTVNSKLMGTDVYQRADARGGSNTLQTGEVGVIYNTRVVMSQNVNYVYGPNADTQSATINNSGGYAAGTATALTVTDPGTDWTAGEYVLIDGNDQPTFVASTGSATSITLNEELKYSVIDTAPITHYLKGANEAVVRAAGYQKEMKFTHSSGKNYQEGQLLSFGTGGSRHTYTIIEVSATTATTTTVLLDRPLDAQVGSAEACFPGPAGAMCPVLHQDAIALVTRTMEPVGTEISGVANANGVGLRVVRQYDSKEGGWRVNVDLLAGISVLDEDLCCVLCA